MKEINESTSIIVKGSAKNMSVIFRLGYFVLFGEGKFVRTTSRFETYD